MAARIDIPLTFPDGAPPPLKRDLERLARGVYEYAQAAPRLFAARPAPQAQTQAALAFDATVPFSLLDGDGVKVALPRPKTENGGRKCGLIRKSSTGVILVFALGCMIDGADRYRLSHAIGYTGFFFDGENYWSSRAGVAEWGG